MPETWKRGYGNCRPCNEVSRTVDLERGRCYRNPVTKCSRCAGSGKEPDWEAVGASMRALRKSKSLGLRELGRELGISEAYLSDMELGKRGWKSPTASKVRSYLEGLPEAI